MKKTLMALAAVVVVAAATFGSWTAFAEAGDDTTARGTCESRFTELSVEQEDGGMEVSFELQSTVPGEAWDVVLQQGDSTLLEGQRQTDEDADLGGDVVFALRVFLGEIHARTTVRRHFR